MSPDAKIVGQRGGFEKDDHKEKNRDCQFLKLAVERLQGRLPWSRFFIARSLLPGLNQ